MLRYSNSVISSGIPWRTLGTLISCRTRSQRQEFWPKIDLGLSSDNWQHLYESVAQNCGLNLELFNFIHKTVWLPSILNFFDQFVQPFYKWNLLDQGNILYSPQKKQPKGKFRSQIDDSAQNVNIGDAANSGQQNVVVKDDTVDRGFTVENKGNISTTKEITVEIQTLQKCLF